MTGTPNAGPAGETSAFDDLLLANRHYQERFPLSSLDGRAARRLAVVTCMDSRIDPLGLFGIGPGDAKITRNAGARVTEDVLRSLALATALLGVDRIAVVQHTDCALTKSSEDELRSQVGARVGADAAGWDFLAMDDQQSTLRADVERVRRCPLIPSAVAVAGFVYDVHSGALSPVGPGDG
jgi:carbonic anhydrase